MIFNTIIDFLHLALLIFSQVILGWKHFIYLCIMLNAIEHIKKELNGLYPDTEIKSFTYLLISKISGLSRTEIIVNKNTNFSIEQHALLDSFIQKLKIFTPIQYILGENTFMGLKFKLTDAVLIPRPETEELVEWVIESNLNTLAKLSILDIGTGSGCIAISLKKQLPLASVNAFDISNDALYIARQNAELNDVTINFKQYDILSDSLENFNYDVIISNPPYITEAEKGEILPNVLNYEPHIALFVPNSNPLLFYQKIIQFAENHLTPKGQLYFEIHRDKGREMIELLKKFKFGNIELRKDLSGNDRMIKAIKL